jgi:hypothetical protein
MFRPGSPQDINVTSIHEADLGVVARVPLDASQGFPSKGAVAPSRKSSY